MQRLTVKNIGTGGWWPSVPVLVSGAWSVFHAQESAVRIWHHLPTLQPLWARQQGGATW